MGNRILDALQQHDSADGAQYVKAAQAALAPLVEKARANIAMLRQLLQAPDVVQLFEEWGAVSSVPFLDHGCPAGLIESFTSIQGEALGLRAEPEQLENSIREVEALTPEESTPNVVEASNRLETVTVRRLRENLSRCTPEYLAQYILGKFKDIVGEVEAWFDRHPAVKREELPPLPKSETSEPFAETDFNPRAPRNRR